MTTSYFEIKTSTQKFKDDLLWTLGEIAEKKIVLFGDIEIFDNLREEFFLDRLHVVAISKMEYAQNAPETCGRFKAISPNDLINFDFDTILVLSENPLKDKEFLCIDSGVGHKEIKFVFNSLLPNEKDLCNYLESINFQVNINKLADRLNGHTVVIYGASELFDVIHRYYDLSQLNVIGICDEKFDNHYENEDYYGLKKYDIQEVKNLNPDCVLIAHKDYIKSMEYLVYDVLKDTGILIKPLARKSFFSVLKEIWC